MLLRLPHTTLHFPRSALLMGIVNVNDDSFCGDGTLDVSLAMSRARELAEQGAEIIDVGAESARTNRPPISVKEEIHRLEKFVRLFHDWRAEGDSPSPLLSINTWRPEVAREILPMGADILNDIGALPDPTNAALCAQHGAALVIMHSIGLPKIPHTSQRYGDIINELLVFFENKIVLALEAGLKLDQLILDPGIDFAKQREDNLRIYRELDNLKKFARPILLPVSRKSVIGHVLGITDPNQRDAGTIACITAGLLRGAHIFRVHNVTAARQARDVLEAVAPGEARRGCQKNSKAEY